MNMRRVILAAALLISLNAMADDAARPLKLDFGWRIDIDANGRVIQFTPDKQPALERIRQLRARLETAVRDWKYRPAMLNGKPAPANTHLYVAATLVPTGGDNYNIRVDSAGTGGGVEHYARVRYPSAALRDHKTGGVMLRIDYNTEGHVVKAAAADNGVQANRDLLDASITSAKQWLFKPELVDGHPVAGSVYSPFCYSIGAQKSCEIPAPGHTDSMAQGEFMSLDPVAQLETKVDGQFL
jgi:hypothetical protein